MRTFGCVLALVAGVACATPASAGEDNWRYDVLGKTYEGRNVEFLERAIGLLCPHKKETLQDKLDTLECHTMFLAVKFEYVFALMNVVDARRLAQKKDIAKARELLKEADDQLERARQMEEKAFKIYTSRA